MPRDPTLCAHLLRCPFQDRARPFPVKGARDALRNLGAVDGTRSRHGISEGGAQTDGAGDGEIPCLLAAAGARRPRRRPDDGGSWWDQASPGLGQEACFFQDSS